VNSFVFLAWTRWCLRAAQDKVEREKLVPDKRSVRLSSPPLQTINHDQYDVAVRQSGTIFVVVV
jgi:hypothetical protein